LIYQPARRSYGPAAIKANHIGQPIDIIVSQYGTFAISMIHIVKRRFFDEPTMNCLLSDGKHIILPLKVDTEDN
jgi:hypothetical protein